MAEPGGLLFLNRREVADLLSLDECIAAVEEAFRLHAAGQAVPPGILGVKVPGGGFHVKATGLTRGLTRDRPYVAIDSTGTGVPDAAGAVLAYEKAVLGGRGTRPALAE